MINVSCAIVIPCFGHPGLMSEALFSITKYQSDEVAAIIINDGCKFEETNFKGLVYQSQFKNFYYLKKENGGLASSRNAGVDYAIKLFPNLEYITFLDPDDRIETKELKKAFNFLKKNSNDNSQIAWTYCHPYQLERFDFMYKGEKYNPLIHLFANANSATSIIDAKVFKNGHRFDENMKLGSEDWAFWIDLINTGYRGIHYPFKLFSYRRRGESIGQNAAINHQKIYDYIKDKYAYFFTSSSIIKLVQNEMKLGTIYSEKEVFNITWDNFKIEKVNIDDAILNDTSSKQDHLNLYNFFNVITVLNLNIDHNVIFIRKIIEISLLNWINIRVKVNENTILELNINNLEHKFTEIRLNLDKKHDQFPNFSNLSSHINSTRTNIYSDKIFFTPWIPKNTLGTNIVKSLLNDKTYLLANWLKFSYFRYIILSNELNFVSEQKNIFENFKNKLINSQLSPLSISPLQTEFNLNKTDINLLHNNVSIKINERNFNYILLNKLHEIVNACDSLRSIIIFDNIELIINFKNVDVNRVLILSSINAKKIMQNGDMFTQILDFEGVIDELVLPSEKDKTLFTTFGFPKEKIKILGLLNIKKDHFQKRYEDHLVAKLNWNNFLEVI